VAKRSATQAFGIPSIVAELNSPASDWPTYLSADGCRMHLASSRGGDYDIWEAVRRP
jgi:hypothetical protein